MKVLFFIESLRAGGKERRIIELLKGLKSYPGIELALVLTRKEIHYNEILRLDIPLFYAERKYFKKDPLVFIKFYRIARKYNPDIIHVWGHMVAFYAVPAKKLLNIPMLNSEITDATPAQRLLGKKWVFDASDRIIANTQAGLTAYKAPTEKSGVIHNGFNFKRLDQLESPEEVRARFAIDTTFVVAMVASFSSYKDHGTYLEAAIDVLDRYQDITFLCVGDGEDVKYREGIPDEYSDRIKFLGKQNHVETIMNICDIGVLATNTKNHGEGISNALMEFMALGKPVIATNFGGSVELIEHGTSGYLIPAFDSSRLAGLIVDLVKDTDKRKRLGQQAKQRIQEKFSIEKMVESFYSEYKRLSNVSDD
jgi:glycosyltransferase involved in cell wall biosynthesis